MTLYPYPKLVPGIYGEPQDVSVEDVARLVAVLLEHQDAEELEEVFAEFIVPEREVE